MHSVQSLTLKIVFFLILEILMKIIVSYDGKNVWMTFNWFFPSQPYFHYK